VNFDLKSLSHTVAKFALEFLYVKYTPQPYTSVSVAIVPDPIEVFDIHQNVQHTTLHNAQDRGGVQAF
jgi:hypothetical protein